MQDIDFGTGPNTGDTLRTALEKLQAGIKALEAGQGGGGNPVEPAFIQIPSINPTSGQAGTVFTGTDGVMDAGGVVLSRRWLLSGTAIGTGTTVTPVTSGLLVLENTGTGGLVSFSNPVNVSAASVPAPVFSTQPAISPNGGTAGTTFTASNGTASNTDTYSRNWLLSGSQIGTGPTVTPNAAGTLVLEVTATGPGGSTIANSPAVTVTASSVPTLGTLMVSPTSATTGTAYTGTVSGRTAGSNLALFGSGAAGLSINSSTGAITGTPTTAGPVDITETLAGATGSPKTTSGVITVQAANAPVYLMDGVGVSPVSRAFGMQTQTAQTGPIMSVANGTGTPFDVTSASEAQAGGATKVVGYYDGAGNLMTLASRLDLVIENGRMLAANTGTSEVALPLPASTLTALGDATGVSALAIVDGIVAGTSTQRLVFLSSNTNASTNGFLMNRINNTLQFAFRQNNSDSATSMTAGGLPNPNKGSSVSLLGIVEYNQGGTRRYRMSRNGARARDVTAAVSTAATLPGAPLAGSFSIPPGARFHGAAIFKGALTTVQSEKLDANTALVQSAGGYLEQNDGISTWWFDLAIKAPNANRVIFSSSTGEGMFAANQANATTRKLQRIKTLGIKAFNLDAHNNVSFDFLPNGALVAATVGHTFNTSASSTAEQQRVMIYYSADGTVDGFDAGRPIPATGTDPGNYFQWHIIDQNNWLGLHDRNNNEAWNYYRWTDGNPNNFTRCRPLHILNPPVNGGTAQTYNRSTRLNATTIRHYVVQHPSNARNLVYLIDLNVNTGEVTSGANSFGSIFDTGTTSAVIDLSNAAQLAQLQVAFDPGAGMTCRVMDAVGTDLLVAYGNSDGTAWQHASVIGGVPKLLGLCGAELETTPQPRRYMTPIVRARETANRRYYRAFNDGTTGGVYTYERLDLDAGGNITRTTLRTAPAGTKMINIAPVRNGTEDFATVLYEGAYSGYDSNRSGATPYSSAGAA